MKEAPGKAYHYQYEAKRHDHLPLALTLAAGLERPEVGVVGGDRFPKQIRRRPVDEGEGWVDVADSDVERGPWQHVVALHEAAAVLVEVVHAPAAERQDTQRRQRTERNKGDWMQYKGLGATEDDWTQHRGLDSIQKDWTQHNRLDVTHED